MHRRFPLLILCQALFCLLETWLISKISWIGRVGIATIHKEYKLLRSGWKTFLLLFGIQLLIIASLAAVSKKYPRKTLHLLASALILIAVAGLFITFQDFMNTYTHRLLKERFHLGFYFFWLGWIGSCVFFLVTARKSTVSPEPFPADPNAPDNTPADKAPAP